MNSIESMFRIEDSNSLKMMIQVRWDNLNEATQNSWHTAVRFKVKIEAVETEPTPTKDKEEQIICKAIVHYSYGYNGQKQSLAINGLLTIGYKALELFEQAKSLIGKKCYFIEVMTKRNMRLLSGLIQSNVNIS